MSQLQRLQCYDADRSCWFALQGQDVEDHVRGMNALLQRRPAAALDADHSSVGGLISMPKHIVGA